MTPESFEQRLARIEQIIARDDIVVAADERWLVAQLREARKDTARLDWLESGGTSIMPTFERPAWRVCDETLLAVRTMKDVCQYAPTVRAAIDAATKAAP